MDSAECKDTNTFHWVTTTSWNQGAVKTNGVSSLTTEKTGPAKKLFILQSNNPRQVSTYQRRNEKVENLEAEFGHN